jgi:hypothetical protein
MAYQQKRSSVVGKVPTVADFGSDTGQLIINTADGKIYMLVGGVVRAFTNDDDLPATAPIGSIIMMASDDKIVPPGCLLMNGAPVTATYPELRAHGIAAGWERNAAGDPLTPDMGGYIARGWRPGQLVGIQYLDQVDLWLQRLMPEVLWGVMVSLIVGTLRQTHATEMRVQIQLRIMSRILEFQAYLLIHAQQAKPVQSTARLPIG